MSVDAALAAEVLQWWRGDMPVADKKLAEARAERLGSLEEELSSYFKKGDPKIPAEKSSSEYPATPTHPPLKATVTIKPLGAPAVEVDQQELEAALVAAGVRYLAGSASDSVMRTVAAQVGTKLPNCPYYEFEQDGRPWGFRVQKGCAK